MIDYINSHMPEFWFITGFVLLALEIVVFGFSIGVLLFAGIGALITGGLMNLGVLPETWIAGIAGFGVSTGFCTAVLWGPMKRLQDKTEPAGSDSSSDLIGHQFNLDSDLSLSSPSVTRYSGIEWRVLLDPSAGDQTVSKGARVIVTSVNVGQFTVKPV